MHSPPWPPPRVQKYYKTAFACAWGKSSLGWLIPLNSPAQGAPRKNFSPLQLHWLLVIRSSHQTALTIGPLKLSFSVWALTARGLFAQISPSNLELSWSCPIWNSLLSSPIILILLYFTPQPSVFTYIYSPVLYFPSFPSLMEVLCLQFCWGGSHPYNS